MCMCKEMSLYSTDLFIFMTNIVRLSNRSKGLVSCHQLLITNFLAFGRWIVVNFKLYLLVIIIQMLTLLTVPFGKMTLNAKI